MTSSSVIIDVVIAGWCVRKNRSNKLNYVTNEPVGTEMKGWTILISSVNRVNHHLGHTVYNIDTVYNIASFIFFVAGSALRQDPR